MTLCDLSAFRDLHALVLAVPHRVYKEMGPANLGSMLRSGGVFMDVKSAFEPRELPTNLRYWSL